MLYRLSYMSKKTKPTNYTRDAGFAADLGIRSTHWRFKPNLSRFSRLERVAGIEPAYSAWKADVLPLNYTRPNRKPALFFQHYLKLQ